MSDTTDNNVCDKKDGSMSMRITCFGIQKRFSKVQQLATEDFHRWMKEGKAFILLDTRPDEEFSVSHIPGALRVEPDSTGVELALQFLKDKEPEKPVVCYCSVGYRSSMLATDILKHLPDDAQSSMYNLEGSIFKWVNEDRPIVDASGQPALQVHPYSVVWGKLLEANKRYNINS